MGDLTKNFSRAEFEASSTAKKHNIDNTIPQKYEKNLKELARQLQIIRDEYQKPIIVASGYRCAKLNKAVGGVQNSDHKFASASDIHSVKDNYEDNKELWDVIIKLAAEGKILLRQIIDEYNLNWIHISVNNKYNPYKKNQILHINKR